jgi:hypothetical protein
LKILVGDNRLAYPTRKAVEWQGLTLRRQPRGPEVSLDLKAIVSRQDAGKALLVKILLELRKGLIRQAQIDLAGLSVADFHTLILSAPIVLRMKLVNELVSIYQSGRQLVAKELGHAAPISTLPSEFIPTLADATLTRVINDVQARVTGSAARFAGLGLRDAQLLDRVNRDLRDGSTGYIDTAAMGASHAAIGRGRGDEGQARSGEWTEVYYSSVLDQNTCGPCLEADGDTGPDEDSIPPAPNDECEGGALCRCIHVFVMGGEA